LQSLGAFMFRSEIIGEPVFKRKLCGGNPGKSSEFKNSVGLFTILFSSVTVSTDLNEINSSGNVFCNVKLISSTWTFLAAKIAHSQSH